jgi:hypothetical protein
MDLYASERKREYDTLLVSIVCIMISSKYHQIKYPGADSLNNMVEKRYTYDQILEAEGHVLDTIKWQLMIFPMYEYLEIFINQGCFFEKEKLLKVDQPRPNEASLVLF